MSVKQFDIAVVGGSLSARIAAVLLAKQGNTVLLLQNRQPPPSGWFHSSLFFEKLLGLLGGRACFIAPRTLQVISKRARVMIEQDRPIEKELSREFGPDAVNAQHFLEKLLSLGALMEQVFWEIGGLPWHTLKEAAMFRMQCVRWKLKPSEIEQPVLPLLEEFPENLRLFLTDLLQGLSLQPIDRLSVGKAALLWLHANRPENLREPDFSQLLNKRFEQFHGLKADLDQLEAIDFDGKRWTGGRLLEESRFDAKCFLLGDLGFSSFFENMADRTPLEPEVVAEYHLKVNKGQLSPLLAPWVICGGDVPLRLALEQQGDQPTGTLRTAGTPKEEQLQEQLAMILPFIRYQLKKVSEKGGHSSPKGLPAPEITGLHLQAGSNLYLADSGALLPGLGTSGAAMLAWTLVTHLGTLHAGRRD